MPNMYKLSQKVKYDYVQYNHQARLKKTTSVKFDRFGNHDRVRGKKINKFRFVKRW